jgi:hypothetical protein
MIPLSAMNLKEKMMKKMMNNTLVLNNNFNSPVKG